MENFIEYICMTCAIFHFCTAIPQMGSQSVALHKLYLNNRQWHCLAALWRVENFHHLLLPKHKELENGKIICQLQELLKYRHALILSTLFNQRPGWINKPCLIRFVLFGSPILIITQIFEIYACLYFW